jgi:hypothetical protein
MFEVLEKRKKLKTDENCVTYIKSGFVRFSKKLTVELKDKAFRSAIVQLDKESGEFKFIFSLDEPNLKTYSVTKGVYSVISVGLIDGLAFGIYECMKKEKETETSLQENVYTFKFRGGYKEKKTKKRTQKKHTVVIMNEGFGSFNDSNIKDLTKF